MLSLHEMGSGERGVMETTNIRQHSLSIKSARVDF